MLAEDTRIPRRGEASTASAALTEAGPAEPTVVLLDIRLPDRLGLEVCRQLKQHTPCPSVLCLTSFADDHTTCRHWKRARMAIF